MRIYIASSWRCPHYRPVLEVLRAAGFDCYDFQNPESAFSWSQIDPNWKSWSTREYIGHLAHPLAKKGFCNDSSAMILADACVLVLPSGRSAHLEAGWFIGQSKPTVVLILDKATEPELMYLAATRICTSIDEMIAVFREMHCEMFTRLPYVISDCEGHGHYECEECSRNMKEEQGA